jgi:anti-sigma factor RsiW
VTPRRDMAECSAFRPMIGSRDGELAPAAAAALQAHLAACRGCQKLAAELAATEGLVAEALLAAAARRDFAPFVDGVLARIAATRPPTLLERTRRLLRLHPSLAIGGALAPLLLAAAVVVLYQTRSGNEVADVQSLELNSVGHTTTVIQSIDGPVLLLDDDDDNES